METKGCKVLAYPTSVHHSAFQTYQLELHGHQAEVDNLHSRPDDEVGLQRGDVHVTQLAHDGTTATTLGDGHDREEAQQTKGRKDELIKGDSLHGGDEGAGLGDGKSGRQELEPAELERRHAETVGHEASQALKVEWGRQAADVGNEVLLVEGVLAVEVVDLDCDTIILVNAPGFTDSLQAKGGNCLCGRIGDATEDGVGHHHGKNCCDNRVSMDDGSWCGELCIWGAWEARTWPLIVVLVELGH